MTTGPNDYAQRAAEAFNRRDVESMLALVCEDFIYLDSMGIQIGRQSMRKRETAILDALPDAKVSLTPFMVADDRLALTALLTGTFTAPLVLPGRVIAPTADLSPSTMQHTLPSRMGWRSVRRPSSTVLC